MTTSLAEDILLVSLKSQLRIRMTEFEILIAFNTEQTDFKTHCIKKNIICNIENQIAELENKKGE